MFKVGDDVIDKHTREAAVVTRVWDSRFVSIRYKAWGFGENHVIQKSSLRLLKESKSNYDKEMKLINSALEIYRNKTNYGN